MAEMKQELDRLIELIAAERRLVRSQARKWRPLLQKGDMAEAQAVITAQQRVTRQDQAFDDVVRGLLLRLAKKSSSL
jgi:hypothetical protein